MTDNKTRPVTPTSDNKTTTVMGCHYNSCGFCGYKDCCAIHFQIDNIKANADYQIEGRDLEIKELKEQIEKMKCCTNCANCNDWGEYNEDNEDCNICKKHSKWKLGTLND